MKIKPKMKILAATFVTLATAGLISPASAQISGDVVKIGFITDLSGAYADIDGPGGANAIRIADRMGPVLLIADGPHLV